jgi:carboxymethylenebutenolidase
VIEDTIDVKTPDGVMSTRTFHPGPGKRWPTILFFMDGIGVRHALVDMARRIAHNGYLVALPNLFYRSGEYAPFDGATVFTNPSERERVMALIKEVTTTRATTDATAVLDALRSVSAADTRRVGTVGYCMGGGPALATAGVLSDRVQAAASYHGGRLATDAPDSPHLLASKARCRLYIGYAENDQSFPEAQRELLEHTLTEAKVPHTMELYKAAHGFAIPDLPPYNKEAADRHWRTLLTLFEACLLD